MFCRIFLRKLTTTAEESQTEECRDGRAESRRFYSRLELLHSSLVPFDHPPLDTIVLEKLKDVLGSAVRGFSGGGSGMNRNPDHDRTKSVLLILAVGHETSWTNGRVENLPILQ